MTGEQGDREQPEPDVKAELQITAEAVVIKAGTENG